MIQVIDFNHDLAMSVVKNIWERGSTEAMRFGMDTDDIRQYISDRVNDKYAYIMLCDELPTVVFGATLISPVAVRTWFVATESFNNYFVPITRELKRMQGNLKKDGIKYIETLSASPHPLAARWFNVLNLKEDPDFIPGTGIRRFTLEL